MKTLRFLTVARLFEALVFRHPKPRIFVGSSLA